MDPHFEAEAEVKYTPLMVSVNAAPPAVATPGLRLVMAGFAGLTVKAAGADVPDAVVTVMLPAPEFSIRLAGTAAVSCVGLTTIVPREVVPHMAAVAGVKAVPVIVSMKPALPAVIEEGLRLAMVGGAEVMAKETADDQPPLPV